MDTSPAQLVSMTLQYIEDLDITQNHLEAMLDREANAEHQYRSYKGKAWLGVEGRTGDERLDKVNELTADLRHQRDLSTGRAKAAMERVRNKRQSLSAIQTALNSLKEESQHSRVGPEYDSDLAERVEAERLRGGVRR